MRITSSMYYENLYGSNNIKLNKELFDVNKQIASGLKIQYASDDVSTFSQTMLLDNEITTLDQTKKSTESGFKVADQSDVILNEFTDSLNRMRTLLLQASNGTNDVTSRNGIAKEMRGIKTNLRSLANTSINGQFIFSGSAINTQPIAGDGTYNGNDVALNAFAGSGTLLKYNITGADLFLGEESLVSKEITSNVVQKANIGNSLDRSTTIENLMGVVPTGRQHNFYLRGTKSDGTSINAKIQLNSSDTVDTLLTQIGKEYGNSGTIDVVNVNMNSNGNIIVADKLSGSSKLDFHLVGASDFGGSDESNVSSIDDLETNGGVTDYNTSLTSASKLYIREFNKSIYTSATGAPTIEGLVYDRTMFNVDGSTVSSDVSQIVNADNSFAQPSTKLLDVASGTTLDNKQLLLKGTNVDGTTISVQVDLNSTGSTFSINGGTNYSIFDMSTPRAAVDADQMTYQQLMDVMNMALTNQLPASTTTDTDYDAAVKLATDSGNTYLSHDGKIKFDDLQNGSTKASISLYDSNSGDFTAGKASVLAFNTNNALTVRDPKTDFFKTVDDMITAVENHIILPDSTVGNSKSVGIENAIAKMDDLQDHLFRTQSTAGAQSNTLTKAIERVDLLSISTKSLRSSVVDTDLAESSLKLSQLTLNYKSMLATVGKVSQLSLVNYL